MTPEELNAVTDAITRHPDVGALRTQFPELIFTECSENDISPRIKPVATTPTHLIYLMTGKSGHCLEMTADLEIAAGVVVAFRDDDE